MASGRFFWPLALIGAGTLFLLDMLGWLPGTAWGWLGLLLLIAVGASLLLRQSNPQPVEDSLALDGAASAAITLEHFAGELRVSAAAEPGVLLAGTFRGGLEKSVRRDGERVEVSLRSRDAGPAPGLRLAQPGLDWAVQLTPQVPLTLNLRTGASRSDLDLAGLLVSEVRLNTGAGQTSVTLPDHASHVRLVLQSQAASVDVRVPEGVAARVHGLVGLGRLDVDRQRFPAQGDSYESPDFATAAYRAEVFVDSALGTVRVQ